MLNDVLLVEEKWLSDGNQDSHEEMKSNGNGSYMGKYKDYFLII